jgi:hypothetical protein
LSLSQRIFRFGAVACVLLALAPAYYAATLEWTPQTSFDIIGFLWLLQNLPRIVAFALAFAFGIGAVYFTIRAVVG